MLLKKWLFQLKKNERKPIDDVDDKANPHMETREENEDSEYQEEASNGRVNIDNLSQNMKSNMTIANCETAESERDLQESGVGLDTQSSLPEVVIVDGLFYFSAFF